MLIHETSEKSANFNWVKQRLQEDKFHILDFEGYTIKENLVSAQHRKKRLFQKLKKRLSGTTVVQILTN